MGGNEGRTRIPCIASQPMFQRSRHPVYREEHACRSTGIDPTGTHLTLIQTNSDLHTRHLLHYRMNSVTRMEDNFEKQTRPVWINVVLVSSKGSVAVHDHGRSLHERELKNSIPKTNVGLALGANPYYHANIKPTFSNPRIHTRKEDEPCGYHN